MTEGPRGLIFDRAAELYHRARPRYPDELFDRIEASLGGFAGREVLEIGPATGVATEALVARGASVSAIEPGSALAAVWASRFGERVTVASFEEIDPVQAHDLVVAATCWHWLDPVTRVQRAAGHLRSGGVLAIWSASHVFPGDADPIFGELQLVYDEIGEGQSATFIPPGVEDLVDLSDELAACDQLDVLGTTTFEWEIRYDAERYIDLLNTFSGHLAMEQWQRDRLFGAIRDRLAERPDGQLRRHWGARLHLARRR